MFEKANHSLFRNSKWSIYVLLILIGLDFFFHLLETTTGIIFPIFQSRTFYTYFWTFYWGLGFLLCLYLWKYLCPFLKNAEKLS